ncbi:unknown [Gryllus bimaculatus nudivirus]|uniref:Uncharacterized protein n=1 Tax=Gryllus bimaculatus nudivirus TaxID=432587 RepID=A4L1Y3_9VIRU|nr:hypothetical protein GrBNV_gp20 [Gryllus bimaculatus nudivirus]ABO45353.1 unknown [Gryllus bimaculatus nudivirus]
MSDTDSEESLRGEKYLDPNNLEFGYSYFADTQNEEEIFTNCILTVKVRPIVDLNVLIMTFSHDSTDNIYIPISGFSKFLQISPKEIYFSPSEEHYNPSKYQYKVEFKASISKNISNHLKADLIKVVNDDLIDLDSMPNV